MKLSCQWCGKVFDSYRTERKFCCKEHYYAYKARNRIRRECAFCGKEFYLSLSLVRDMNFCSKSCARKQRNFEDNPAKREEVKRKIAFARMCQGEGKTYPRLNNKHIHRIVAEVKLGRRLQTGEIVHHIDGNKRNYNPENIQVLKNQREHARAHNKGGRFKSGKIKA